MIRKHTESVTEEREVVDDVLCNKCGKSCLLGEGTPGQEAYGLVETEYLTGYFSRSLPDGHRYTFSICESCLADLFATFVHPPETNSFM